MHTIRNLRTNTQTQKQAHKSGDTIETKYKYNAHNTQKHTATARHLY